MLGRHAQQLQMLRDKIAALETGPVLAEATGAARPEGLLAIPPGTLSEVFAEDRQDSAVALGFTLGLARGLVSRSRPGLIILQLNDAAQKTGVPYGPGLVHFGIEPDHLVLARPQTIQELLWTMEEAIACRAIAAVVADIASFHKELDFTASRRLSLRSAAAGTGVFVVRYAKGREATAARYRWRIAPALSGQVPFDARAPGPPRWRAILEKGRLQPDRQVGGEGEEYLVDWTHDGFVLADIDARDPRRPVERPAVSRSQPATLAHRLPEAS